MNYKKCLFLILFIRGSEKVFAQKEQHYTQVHLLSMVIDLDAHIDTLANRFKQNTAADVTILYSWWSANRSDNFATTDPEWAGKPGNFTRGHDGYTFVRKEGRIFSPESPKPTRTVPLYSWWSANRTDNFITSDPNWLGNLVIIFQAMMATLL